MTLRPILQADDKNDGKDKPLSSDKVFICLYSGSLTLSGKPFPEGSFVKKVLISSQLISC